MSAKHAPGPWRVSVVGGFDNGRPVASIWIESGDYYSVATVIPHSECEANARLIAAAPDLLAMLEELQENTGGVLRDHIDALLERIKGEQS